jgi:hypothetical protein
MGRRRRELEMGKLFDIDDVELGIEHQAAIELYRTRGGLLLLDRANDLRCGVISAGDRPLPGFSRAGVLVVASWDAEAVSCAVKPVDDLAASFGSLRRVTRGPTEQTWVLALANHSERSSTLLDMAAGVVRAELSRYWRVRLDEPPRNLGIVEAPRWVMRAGELTALALRAAGCDLGLAVGVTYPVEHPDLWDD